MTFEKIEKKKMLKKGTKENEIKMKTNEESKIGRKFAFTWNNYPPNYKDIIKEYKNIKYLITGEEVSKTGTPHLQGFIKTIDSTTFKKISKMFGNCHVEHARGTDEENDNYCRGIGKTAKEHGKDPTTEDKLFIIGEIESHQGERNDIKKIKKAINDGENIKSVIQKYADTYQDIKYAESLLKYTEIPRVYAKEFKFIWIYGPTETGKTKYVLNDRFKKEYDEGKIYMAMNNAKWWDGYEGQEILLIDDFRDNYCGFSNLLQICQPVEYRVEVKGGTRQLKAMTIIITSCYAPIEVYEGIREKRNQLYRRITELIHFYELGKYRDETEELKKICEILKERDKNREKSIFELAKDTYEIYNESEISILE